MAHGLPGEPGADAPTSWPAMEEALRYRKEIERRAKHHDALVEALGTLLDETMTAPAGTDLGDAQDQARTVLDAAKEK